MLKAPAMWGDWGLYSFLKGGVGGCFKWGTALKANLGPPSSENPHSPRNMHTNCSELRNLLKKADLDQTEREKKLKEDTKAALRTLLWVSSVRETF